MAFKPRALYSNIQKNNHFMEFLNLLRECCVVEDVLMFQFD